jgi:hypothetical protein
VCTTVQLPDYRPSSILLNFSNDKILMLNVSRKKLRGKQEKKKAQNKLFMFKQ